MSNVAVKQWNEMIENFEKSFLQKIDIISYFIILILAGSQGFKSFLTMEFSKKSIKLS